MTSFQSILSLRRYSPNGDESTADWNCSAACCCRSADDRPLNCSTSFPERENRDSFVRVEASASSVDLLEFCSSVRNAFEALKIARRAELNEIRRRSFANDSERRRRGKDERFTARCLFSLPETTLDEIDLYCLRCCSTSPTCNFRSTNVVDSDDANFEIRSIYDLNS